MRLKEWLNPPLPPTREVHGDKDLIDALCDDANLPPIEIWEYMRALARRFRDLESR